MLVLTRRADEQIQIGSEITVTVVRIAEGVVRIGIEAPDHVTVMRQELSAPYAPVQEGQGSRDA